MTSVATGSRVGPMPNNSPPVDPCRVLRVAQHASCVEASRRLAIPTSSVSRAVARLEDELDVQLLRRTSRKVAVTDEGRQLLLRAAAHVEGLEEALASAADRHPEPSGV